jgi:hypothetical protein
MLFAVFFCLNWVAALIWLLQVYVRVGIKLITRIGSSVPDHGVSNLT